MVVFYLSLVEEKQNNRNGKFVTKMLLRRFFFFSTPRRTDIFYLLRGLSFTGTGMERHPALLRGFFREFFFWKSGEIFENHRIQGFLYTPITT